jgi:hypothetical protein
VVVDGAAAAVSVSVEEVGGADRAAPADRLREVVSASLPQDAVTSVIPSATAAVRRRITRPMVGPSAAAEYSTPEVGFRSGPVLAGVAVVGALRGLRLVLIATTL